MSADEGRGLEGDLDLVAGHLPAALIPEGDLGPIRAVARLLPQADAGFECRLGGDPARTDFAAIFEAGDGRGDILAGERSGGRFPVQTIAHPAWGRLRDFCREWGREGSPLHARVGTLSMEFDLDGRQGECPVPRVFIGCRDWGLSARGAGRNRPSASEVQEVLAFIWRILALLQPVPPESLRSSVHRFLDTLPAMTPASLFTVGTAIDRPMENLRLTVAGVSPAHLAEILGRVGWSRHRERLQDVMARLLPHAGRMDVAADVGPGASAKVGLSVFYPAMAQPDTDRRWYGLLDHLVDSGLCTAEKRRGLLGWPGVMRYERKHSFPEPDFPAEACALPWLTPRWILARLLHHVKVDCFEDGSCSAKAYFGFRHLCMLMNRSR